MKKDRRFRSRLFTPEKLEVRTLLAANPVITEFSASNRNVVTDGFGESPDWIEISNLGDEAIDLKGFHLTDNADNLSKWTFNETTNLNAGEFLVVYASGRQDPVDDPTGSLHTNFRISSDGEYLALVSPENVVLSQFGTSEQDFPKQLPDISYGLGQTSRSISLVDSESVSQVLIPDSNDLASSWTNIGFSTDGWTDGGNGIGYDTTDDSGRVIPGGVSVLQLDFNDADSGEEANENTEDGWSTFDLSNNGVEYDGIKVTVSPVGGISLNDRDRTAPIDDPPILTYDQIFDDFIFANSRTDGTGMEVLLEGLTPNREYEITLWSYDVGSVNPRVSNWNEVSAEVPFSIESSYTFDGADEPTANFDNTMTALLTASAEGSLRIQGVRNGGTSFGVFLNALQIVAPTASEFIQTDLQDDMFDKQSSAFVRYPFSSDDTEYERLSLNMQYDSGFVAYLNGQEIARRNVADAPGVALDYNSFANSERSLNDTVQPEIIDVSSFADKIVSGDNVLAVHGVNSATENNDFLIRAELIAEDVDTQSEVYFGTPTPGALNSGEAFAGITGDTTFSLDRGFYTEPVTVDITSSTPGASIAYTTDGSPPSPTNGTIITAPNDATGPTANVAIATTTYLRAMSFSEGFLPSNIDTQTYIYLDDVIKQDPLNDANAPEYPTRWQANATADFEMDPEVVAQWDDNNPDNQDFGIREALTSIPTMSVVMEHDDLWGRQGIYVDATRRGDRFRRAASVEYFDPNTGDEFQVNAGIQMHGGASRDNVRLKKHSFRLLFRQDFGDTVLNYPLFSDTDNEEFNTLVLRAFFTDSFPTRSITDRYNPIESQYLRDVWMKDSQLAMGAPSMHNTYVHLYINGLYWGLYNPAERPDDAFLSTYLGGEREDWDIVKDFNELFAGSKDAWNEMFSLARDLTSSDTPEAIYQQLQGNNPDGTPNDELPNYLDVDNLIDFMILHLYAGVEDWPHHNWYAARNRVDPGKGYQFFVWDQEIGVDHRYRDRTTVRDSNTPAELYSRLYRSSAEFRLRFADRVNKHFSEGGALTVEANQARYMARANEIEKAIIGESARWGDAREGERHRLDTGGPTVTIPVMTVDHWRTERDRVINTIFADEERLLFERLLEIGLVTEVNAPVFNQPGGAIDTEFKINITAPQDPTLDTTDILPEFSPVTVFVPMDGSLDPVDENSVPEWVNVDFDDSDWISGVGGVGFDTRTGYEDLLGVDLFADTIPQEKSIDPDGDGRANSVSFYSRYAFDLAADFDPSAFDRFMLRAKFDDGFAAFLNGQYIGGANHATPVAFDARATASVEADPDEFDEFDMTPFMALLKPGEKNVLAIQGFNRSPTNNDLLVSPELVVGKFREIPLGPVYYTIDGTDPRLSSGEINAESATLFAADFALSQSATVKARTLLDGEWSALSEATFTIGDGNPTNFDFNADDSIDIHDLNQLCVGVRTQTPGFDVNGDGSIDLSDVGFMLTNVLQSVVGDTNLDGVFDSADLVNIFQTGQYEDGANLNSNWSDGDWNCDGDFTSSDLVTAFQAGTYSSAAKQLDLNDIALSRFLDEENERDATLFR